MGLDMYLSSLKLHGYSVKNARAVEDWLNWQAHLDDIRKGIRNDKPCTFNEWCGKNESDVTPDMIEALRPEYKTHYYSWDSEKKYPFKSIDTPLASWRKANAIHRWFVENVQNGEDNCGEYAVSKSALEKLREICQTILDKVKLVPGKVHNGDKLVNGKWEPIYEDGYVVANPEICEDNLPSQDGFFFGSTEFDTYYIDDVKNTVKIIDDVMKTVDWDTETVTYSSSW